MDREGAGIEPTELSQVLGIEVEKHCQGYKNALRFTRVPGAGSNGCGAAIALLAVVPLLSR